MIQYGKSEYWDERYSRDIEPFDWYQRFSTLKDMISPYITPESKILNVGAGNSRMSEEMFDEGYQNITNIDISQVVIKAMSEKYRDKGPNFKYIQMDARAMDFIEGEFDCVIDKATLDSILCGEGSTVSVQKMLGEIHRVLSPKGIYIVISFGLPDNRLAYLQKPEYDWTVSFTTIPKPSISTSNTPSSEDKETPQIHHIYFCKRNGPVKKNEENNVAPAPV